MKSRMCKNKKCKSGRPVYSKGYCSRCYNRQYKHGDPNAVLKRGTKPKDGHKLKYVFVWDKRIKNNTGIHRILMENFLGRNLIRGETVHHINGVTDDNRIDNLELWSSSQPAGQRVEDKVNWAIELLNLYRPEALTASYANRVAKEQAQNSEEK